MRLGRKNSTLTSTASFRREEMRAFDAHVRGCPSCAADALARVQMKRAIQAGERFTAERRVPRAGAAEHCTAARSVRSVLLNGWLDVCDGCHSCRPRRRDFNLSADRAPAASRPPGSTFISEIADLHVETLASSSPVDVVSTDRHTVKPWFQGKIPFAFNLPELQNTEFSLMGGRMTYLDQAPGAHLIYDVRKAPHFGVRVSGSVVSIANTVCQPAEMRIPSRRRIYPSTWKPGV